MRPLLIIQNDDVSGPGTLDQALHDLGCTVDLWMAEREPRRRFDLGDFSGMLAFGGRADPQRREPWLDHERQLIERAVEHAVPYLGVCLGGELLAQIAGGAATSEPPTQMGWHRIEATDAARDDPLFHDVDRPVFEYHYNGIHAPPHATVLARRDGIDQAFRLGERAWGVQFHIEVDLDMLWRLLVEQVGPVRRAGLDPNALHRQSAELAPAHVAWARELARRFVSLLDE